MRNSLATCQAAAGKRMFFCPLAIWGIAGPVGLAFSFVPLLLPTLVTRIAMMPAARTRAPTTSNQRLKRRDDRAFWTTLAFTAIRIVDAGNRVRLEDWRLGPGAPRVS